MLLQNNFNKIIINSKIKLLINNLIG